MNEIYKTFNLNDIKRKDTYVEETLISGGTDYSDATETDKGYYKKYALSDNVTIYETHLTTAKEDVETYRNYLKFKNLLLDDSSDSLFASEGSNMTILSFDRDDHYFDELSGNTSFTNLGDGYVIGESEFTSRGERVKLMNAGRDTITGYIYTKLGFILFNANIVVSTLFEDSNTIKIGCKRKVYQSIYICNIGVDDFNFTNNGTATDENGEYIEDFDIEDPTVYITTLGLYNNDNELIAVGKFSNPIKKDSVTPLVFSATLEALANQRKS